MIDAFARDSLIMFLGKARARVNMTESRDVAKQEKARGVLHDTRELCNVNGEIQKNISSNSRVSSQSNMRRWCV